MIAEGVYLLCALTSAGCALALLRMYRRRRTAILLWSSLCFVGLSMNNALLYLDLVILPTEVDLALARAIIGAASMLTLVGGLIWNVE
ncbi:MAG TPA: DUF5985 family protein [Vicinamibacterales bacterium]|jgi:hypothetical protein|nr:DUF5985 family protein [Vicinamibacterales bacterium]